MGAVDRVVTRGSLGGWAGAVGSLSLLAACYVGGEGELSAGDTSGSESAGEAATGSAGITGITGGTGGTGDPGTTTGDPSGSTTSGDGISASEGSSTTEEPSGTTTDEPSGTTTDEPSGTTADTGDTEASTTGDSESGDSESGDSESGGGESGGGDFDNTTQEGVCGRWQQDFANLADGPWDGNVAACDPGDTAPVGRANALKLINFYRWLADLPPVTHDPTRNAKAQACALLMHANQRLSHSPPMSWSCYSADGAQGAGSSNISPTPGVPAVGLYMADPGNPTTIGHRRWILANSLGRVGLGSTSGYSCMWVLGGSGGGANQWTAWPAPGPFPLQSIQPSWASIDDTGWTIQSDSIALGNAQVKITADGQDRPVAVTTLLGGYGSAHAISMIPQGWKSTAGTTYKVEVTGISQPITYEVTIVDCS